MHRMKFIPLLIISCIIYNTTLAQNRQWVEGFDTIVFHHDKPRETYDFRGLTWGYMTAQWWAHGEMENNTLSWKTAIVPDKKPTTFVFIGECTALPSAITVGPSVQVSVNGQYALTFTLGKTVDHTWKEGDYTLKYIAKRIQFPYYGSQREYERIGNSGVYQLSVPASVVEAEKQATIEIKILPFERWHDGWFMIKEHKHVLSESMNAMQGEIASLQNDMNRVQEQLQILATRSYSKTLGRDRFKNEIIYTDGYHHLHPADLIPLRNGDILLMTREGTEHIANDGDVIMLRSKDGGKTWGDKQVVGGIKDLDEREGCGVQLRNGTILVGIFFNNLYNADGTYMPSVGRRKPGPHPDYPALGAYIINSKDNGYTWSKPHIINTKGMPFKDMEGPTHSPIQMPDGSILMGMIGYDLNGDRKNTAAVMLRSTDIGETWKYYSTIASDPGGKLGAFVEPGIVRTKTGRIVAMLRNAGPDQAIWSTYSDDGGKTWEKPWETPMIGHPCDIIQLADGRLMASYGIRPPWHTLPGGIRACFSKDNGKSWDIQTEVQLRNDFMNWDIGYPESLQLPNGKVLTAYYFNLFGRYFIGETFWNPNRENKN
ncbi:MAG: exo-alpha-sialidase [Chitinophagaceae bacterium]|nr:MAG: exo-alpha-sialidase [Chitinophagaceae bacterium]